MVNSATAHFDPTAFKLPDGLKHVTGPEVQAPPVTHEIRFVEQQLALEQAQAPVAHNLQRQLKQAQEQARAEQLKQVLLSLKNLRPLEPTSPDYYTVLLQAIESLKACFSGESTPTDLETMGLLFPLLKCQEHKWECLKKGQPATPPGPEARLLQKWRSAKISLSAVEKATFYQIVEGLNFLIARLPVNPAEATHEPSEPRANTVSEQPPVAEQLVETVEPFDPMTCGRRLLQLRAAIQRSCAESEKKRLQGQLETLLQQQNAYYAERRSQSLAQHQKKYTQLCLTLGTPLGSGPLQKLRQELIQQLESLQRLFAQDKQHPAGPDIFSSASRQLARLGLNDAAEVRAHEERQQLKWIQTFAAVQQAALNSWYASYQQLLTAFEQALQQLNQEAKQSQAAGLTAQIKTAQTRLQAQRQALAQLEQAWQGSTDPAEQSELRQKILLAYAQLILDLPEAT